MIPDIEKPLSAKEFGKEFDQHMDILIKKMHENGSLIVEDNLGQLSMDMGINTPIDEMIPPSIEELEWLMKP